MKQIEDCYLYGILDLAYVPPERIVNVTSLMIEGGIDVLQLRAKNYTRENIVSFAQSIRPMTEDRGIPLIINDYPDLAYKAFAHGAHVGQDDMQVNKARPLALGNNQSSCIIGKSTHSLEQAIAAEKEGADYIGFGPLFGTPTKPDYTPIGLDLVQQVHRSVKIPIFCIGGIKLENIVSVLVAGARRVVIVSGILQATDIVDYTRAVKKLLLTKLHSSI